MAGRPEKAGLDYFSLDCHMDDKIRLIQAEFGLKGFAVVIKLFQEIYGECGYYCRWDEDALLLFMAHNGIPPDGRDSIAEIVSACIRRKIFSERMHQEHGILTSAGIQKRYLLATRRRGSAKIEESYLLVKVDQNQNFADENSINVSNNSINVDINSESKVKKSKYISSSSGSAREAEQSPLEKAMEEPEFARVMQSFTRRINAAPSPACGEELADFYQRMEPDVMIAIFDCAADEKKTAWSYVRAVLRRCVRQGVRTLADWQRSNEEFEQAKTRKGARPSRHKDVISEWMEEQG